jgi:Nuclear pore localisation protein NPL4
METRTAHDSVTVSSNGVDKTVTYQPHEAVEAVLNRAENDFGIQQNRHLMSLFTTDNRELDDKTSMQDAGVKPGDLLVLRQSTVKGG